MSHGSSLKRKFCDSNAASSDTTAASAASRGGWQNGLKLAMTDSGQALFSDAECVIIADKYPKASHHYLVMPRDHQIDSLTHLTSSDAPLLRHMLTAARRFITDKNLQETAFRFGFHAVPSMSQLHMHVVSQDFVSPCLKSKKHWLSFTSEFFLDCQPLLDVLESGAPWPLGPRVALQGGRRLAIDRAWFAALVRAGELKCNQCDRVCKNMPELKAHLARHLPQAADK